MDYSERVVAVFGGTGDDQASWKSRLAEALGREVARRQQLLLTGGSLIQSQPTSVKDAAIRGAVSAGGRWIGVPREEGASGAQGAELRGFEYRPGISHKRNYVEASVCDVAIVLPGGPGTLSEALFSLALRRPVVFVGSYWTRTIGLTEGALMEHLKSAMERVQWAQPDSPLHSELKQDGLVVKALTEPLPACMFYPDPRDVERAAATVIQVALDLAGDAPLAPHRRRLPDSVFFDAADTKLRNWITEPFPHNADQDLAVADELPQTAVEADRLVFDGYQLKWLGSAPATYTGFSGAPGEDVKESVKEIGPTPQGKYAVDPANIEALVPSDDWGSFRVKLEPYKATVDRMKDCFKLVRTGMYIHGGTVKGTHGCIELNDDSEEKAFFDKLKKHGAKIELEVKYVGGREKAYEEPACPY